MWEELPLLMEDLDDNKLLNCAIWGEWTMISQPPLKFGDYLGVRRKEQSSGFVSWRVLDELV